MLAALPVGAAAIAQPTRGPSVFQSAPNDPRAVTVRAKGDGVADDSAALQQAIDTASAKPGGGIVFLPAGKYRITRTLFIWPGVRVFGVGRTRPVLMLAANTPGFQRGVGTMVLFAGNNPRGVTLDNWGNPIKGTPTVPVPPPNSVPFDASIADANSGTFYSALSNVDFEIGEGNPAATGVRQHTAQHTYLAHIDFRLGSALAGVYQVGNLGMDLRFFGGRYGILAEKTSPAWQYTLLDSTFDGQRDAAIREHDASFTLVNTLIRNTPVGIDIDRGHSDRLWGSDVRFENVSQAGVVISNEGSVFTQIGFAGALASNTPTFARFRDSGRTVAGKGARYRVGEFTHGLTVDGLNQPGSYQTRFDAAPITSLPKRRDPAIRALPPVSSWVDVRTLGVKGDNTADDTQAIQRAIDRNRVLYFPAGFYRVTHTLKLRPDTVLIGLHPGLTQIVLPDDLPNYRDVGSPKALIESAKGGDAIVSGVGLFTGGVNPRATAMLWRAGERSLVDDVKFQGGHGTTLADGSRFEPYNPNHTADADVTKRWDGQFSSLWVTDNGGGTFNGLWTPNTYAHAGLYVSNTSTPGHVYEMSAEHHARAEIVLDGVRNWNFYAPQTEEEAGESRNAVALEVRNSRNILFANFHGYRVTRSIQPAPAAVKLYGSTDIRFRNVHVNAESGFATCDDNGCGTYLRASKFPYENALTDVTRGGSVREREFAVLDISDATGTIPTTATMAPVSKLADGFYSIGGGAVDQSGKLYFIDRQFQRIHGWSDRDRLSVVADAPLDAINLAVDGSSDLLVMSSDGPETTVYAIDPKTPNAVRPIAPTAARGGRSARVALPGSFWNNGEFRDQYDPARDHFTTLPEMFARDMAAPKPREYVSPDGSLVLPAWRVWQQGPANHLGWRFSDLLDTYGWITGKVGDRIHVINASENRTYSGLLGAGGAVSDLKPFAPRGGESVAAGPDGRVYVANGQVFVYDAAGVEVGRIDVPDRPLQLLFGGEDKRTLYILTHHALYSARP
ncbi:MULTISPECIES: glycosyl hydrolase family 28-related protein [Sphingomonas]|uniref:Gluconolaconase n=2 Tax=Sphingomonas hankookensis TaxID=563996 RepID=A0ABR5YC82_9SPHN|nr:MULTISPECIES: glycosyl hydrolase family 28-related protein [Sphingomonas]KZE11877.1 gluconolaconase [Sphingomonas hankookensis]PZT93241.1 MAG: gluconolaconase [Sphingomonas sp.]RSV29060.1 gluconolaconase [Sphingomonas sp. ABOLH]WCP73642.1 glycosyl hydrolase family 28-related protein [Sphingomonas hankookensis]